MDIDLVVNELRKKHSELYKTEFTTGAVFIWRPLSYYEYDVIVNKDINNCEKEHLFCALCVLYSIVGSIEYMHGEYDFSRGPAGYATCLTEEILRHSGFADDGRAKEMYDEAKGQMEFFYNQIPCIIKMAFGDEFKFDEILTWSLKKQFYYLARAEWMLQMKALLYTGRAELGQVQIKPNNNIPQKPKPKPDRDWWMSLKDEDWEEISEQQFLMMYGKETGYESEVDPNLYKI